MIVKRVTGEGWVLELTEDERVVIGAALGAVARSFDASLSRRDRQMCHDMREHLLEGPFTHIAAPPRETP